MGFREDRQSFYSENSIEKAKLSTFGRLYKGEWAIPATSSIVVPLREYGEEFLTNEEEINWAIVNRFHWVT